MRWIKSVLASCSTRRRWRGFCSSWRPRIRLPIEASPATNEAHLRPPPLGRGNLPRAEGVVGTTTTIPTGDRLHLPDNPANDASGKTKLEHRKQSGRRMNEEPNYQPNDRSDRTSGSGSNYCPMYGRRLCAPGGRKFAWRRPNRTFTFGASVHGNLPSGASTRMVPGYPTTPGSGRRRREAESVKGMP